MRRDATCPVNIGESAILRKSRAFLQIPIFLDDIYVRWYVTSRIPRRWIKIHLRTLSDADTRDSPCDVFRFLRGKSAVSLSRAGNESLFERNISILLESL